MRFSLVLDLNSRWSVSHFRVSNCMDRCNEIEFPASLRSARAVIYPRMGASCASAIALVFWAAIRPTLAQDLPPDIIAITGGELPKLLGVPLAEITATAVHAGTLTAVHVQIDRRQRAGDGSLRYVFETGDEPS